MSATPPAIYHLRLGWRIWALGCLGLGMLGLGLLGLTFFLSTALFDLQLGTERRQIGPFLALCVGAACLVLLWYGWNLFKMSLRVSAKGLEYRGLNRQVHIRWQEVASYGPVGWGGPWATDGLVVQHPVIVGIPLELFVANWPLSPLGVTIQHYAPQLTSASAPPSAPPPAPAPTSAPPRRRRHRRGPLPVAPLPVARPAITRHLRPLRPAGDAIPGEWQGTVTGRLEEHDGDTVRF